VTAQNTLGVQAWEAVSPELVRAQMASVAVDLSVDAAKTGMLATAAIVEVVAATVAELGIGPLVVDPVLVSGQGDRLLDAEGIDVMKERLFPLASVVTPNIGEAATLTGRPVEDRVTMVAAARAIAELGPDVVLVTGGHLESDDSPDCVFADGEVRWLESPRIRTRDTHGGGCV